MIEARAVSKHFGRRKVLDSLDMRISDGEIVALMGPNGAGKTTLIRILSTLLQPTSGDVFLDGRSLFDDPVVARRSIGVIGHSTYAYDDLTALENMRFYWSMYSLPGGEFDRVAPTLLKRVGLGHRLNDRASVFSKGMRQRLAIARAVLHSPKVLLLDEPFSSLDQKGAEILSQILLEQRARGCSVLMVAHDIQRIAALADRADILTRGRIEQSYGPSSMKSGDLEAGYRKSSEAGVI